MLALVPFDVVTTTLAVPAAPGGVEQVADEIEITLKEGHALPPTKILVAPVRLSPVIVMEVPPAVVPEFGDTDLTTGGNTA